MSSKERCEKMILMMHSFHFNWKIRETEKWIELRRESHWVPNNSKIIMKFKTWYRFSKWLKKIIRIVSNEL